MARNGITITDVFDAADKINDQGLVVTIDRVRQMMGNVGSNTTISKYIGLWRQKGSKAQKKTKDYYRGYEDAIRKMSNILKTLY